MDPNGLIRELPILVEATLSTLAISAVSFFSGLVIGVFICFGRLSRSPPLQQFGRAYISLFRGVPLIVQLLLIYYILPKVGLNVLPITAAIIGLSFCTAAYIAEIFRGGFSAIPAGQREAAEALGMAPWKIRRRIEMPQVLRIVWPALVNDFILLIKASSLISVVGVFDLTRASQNIAAATFQPVPAYLGAAAIYLMIILTIVGAARLAERRLGRWELETRL